MAIRFEETAKLLRELAKDGFQLKPRKDLDTSSSERKNL